MLIEIEVKKATVILQLHSMDICKLYLEHMPFPSHMDSMVLEFRASKNKGVDYLTKNFNIPEGMIEVIDGR